jgi:hypothetical protein
MITPHSAGVGGNVFIRHKTSHQFWQVLVFTLDEVTWCPGGAAPVIRIIGSGSGGYIVTFVGLA